MSGEDSRPASSRAQFRQLAVLIGISFVDMLGFMLVMPLLPFYALQMSATPEMIGMIIAAFSVAQLIASPFWGRVSDRYGRRPVLMIGLAASGIGFLVFGLADTIALLLLSRVIQGAGGGTTGVAQAYVTETVGAADRARALGWLSAASAAGVMLGPALGSLVAVYGISVPGYVAAGLCFLNVLATWRWLPESQSATMRTARPRPPVLAAASRALLHPAGAQERLIWIYGVGMLAFSLWTSILALWLGARFGVTEHTIGWFFVYNGLLSLILRSLVLGPVVRRFGEVRTMQTGAAILGVGLLLYPLTPGVWWLIVVIPFIPVGTALLFPASTSLLSSATDPADLGTIMGVAQTFAGVARIIAPLLGGVAFQRLGIEAPFVLAGLTMLAVAMVARRVMPRPDPLTTPQ